MLHNLTVEDYRQVKSDVRYLSDKLNKLAIQVGQVSTLAESDSKHFREVVLSISTELKENRIAITASYEKLNDTMELDRLSRVKKNEETIAIKTKQALFGSLFIAVVVGLLIKQLGG